MHTTYNKFPEVYVQGYDDEAGKAGRRSIRYFAAGFLNRLKPYWLLIVIRVCDWMSWSNTSSPR